jgi:hypothetical protein
MKSKLMIFLVPVLFAVAIIVGIQLSRGLGELVISDVTQPTQKTIKAPIAPFRNGALFVIVDGQLDGNATLQITSNYGRDHRMEGLSGTVQSKTIGGAEEWSDDLIVQFIPGTAKQGHIRILMACGKNVKRTD